MARKLYTIGELSKLSNATVKELHYLDKIGLLHPKERDSNNRYRYYSDEQLEQLIYYMFLKKMGFEYDEILKLIENYSYEELLRLTEKKVEERRRDMVVSMAIYQDCMDYYNRLIRGFERLKVTELNYKSVKDIPIRMEVISERLVLFKRGEYQKNVEDLFIDRYTGLIKYAEKFGIEISGEMSAIMHSGFRSQFTDVYGDLETCLTVKEGAYIPQDKNIRIIPKFKGVTAIHIGTYPTMKPLFIEMERWAKEKGYEIGGISMEDYIVTPYMVPTQEEFVTKLILPLKEYENEIIY